MKKEKIFVLIATVIILIGILVAFIISNSQKTPPEVYIQNSNQKEITGVLGGYTWKSFGNNIVADSIDLTTATFAIDNTMVSKPDESLKILTTDKFSVQEIEYVSSLSNESFEISYNKSETENAFTITSPGIEGTYICKFILEFSKGNAEYAFKLIVTDENVYDVKEIVEYKNTSITDVSNIKNILNGLPYAEQLDKVMVNELGENKTVIIRYKGLKLDRDNLLNNTIALFALIPNVDIITYKFDTTDMNKEENDIYYSRDEINYIASRDVVEYVNDIEAWTREVIYKEQVNYSNARTIYSSAISSILAKISDKQLGDYIAIDVTNNSGDVLLNEYDVNKLLDEISNEYDAVLSIDANEFKNVDGTLVKVEVNKEDEETYKVKVNLKTKNGDIIENTYTAIRGDGAITLQEFEDSSNDENKDNKYNEQSKSSGEIQ